MMSEKDLLEYENIGRSIKRSNKYKYITGTRIEDHGTRLYDVNGSRLPSVTTILGKTKDQTFLKDWIKSKGAKAIQAGDFENISPKQVNALLAAAEKGKGAVVDMSNEEVSANGVHIAGSMQGWDPAASEMTDADGDGKYEIEFQLATGTSVAYKFVNGNDWDSAETVPVDCATDGNRTLDVPNFDRPYEVCYGSCEACPAPAVYADVVLTVVDEGNGFEDVEFKG